MKLLFTTRVDNSERAGLHRSVHSKTEILETIFWRAGMGMVRFAVVCVCASARCAVAVTSRRGPSARVRRSNKNILYPLARFSAYDFKRFKVH